MSEQGQGQGQSQVQSQTPEATTDVVKSPQQDDGLDRKTLFIRSIPFEATSDQISEFFSQFVPVKHAVIVNDNEQKSRGFGFVSFTEEEDSLTALVESRKAKFQGRLLRVDIAKRRERKDRNQISTGTETKRTTKETVPIEKRRARLIIRNLPWSCKKPDTLKKIFSKYGAVFDAYIPKKKGGQMTGFAFVTMKKQSAADKAVKESVGLKIDGREVAVDLALEKSKWEEIKENESEEEEDEEEEEEEDDEDKDESNEESQEDVTKVDDDEDEDDEEDEEAKEDAEDFHNLNEINSDDEPEEEEEEETPRKKSNRQEAYSVFVRNIPYDADSETLSEHFSQFGPVKYALPVIDKETGLAKGSAFVAFTTQEAFNECLDNAPSVASTSMLIADDVSPAYVYQGRILSVTSSVDRQSANRLAERNSEKRKEVLGKAPGEKDKRNLFLLNEGRITSNSKLAQYISKSDLEIREKSYKLRVQQLNKNPSLHLSFTRLAIRNLPRAMNSKALKALGRKAVVQFATEVKENKRQPLSKEEVNRSIKFKQDMNELEPLSEKKKKDAEAEAEGGEEGDSKKKHKHKGVVKQAKVIFEVKGSGEAGRSRGYGFVEFRDHKAALMGLRWLNAHEVTIEEIVEGLTDEEKKVAQLEGLNKRRLIVEFAVENAQVVRRRREKVFQARNRDNNNSNDGDTSNKKRSRDDEGGERGNRRDNKRPRRGDDDRKDNKKGRKGSAKKGNMNKGGKPAQTSEPKPKSGLSEDVKKIIGIKRKRRKGKK